jgi:hypothetical protein
MHGLRTDALRDGAYHVEVLASDIRGNTSRFVAELSVANHAR